MRVFVFFLVVFLGCLGYVFNVVNFIAEPLTGLSLLRAIGIILWPIGMILGYF